MSHKGTRLQADAVAAYRQAVAKLDRAIEADCWRPGGFEWARGMAKRAVGDARREVEQAHNAIYEGNTP